MKIRKQIFSLLLSVFMIVGFVQKPVYATGITTNISNIKSPTEVTQGKTTNLVFDYAFNTDLGSSFVTGDTINVSTNMGELFEANWDSVAIQNIKDEQENVLATAKITADTILFTIQDGANGQSELSGTVKFTTDFTAKDVGATADNPIEKELVIGNAKTNVTFKAKETNDNAGTGQPGAVDITTFWKNGWAISNNKGATISMEVNPIGSMDLYGSTTYANRTPVIHDNLVVKDGIPEKGFVDVSSVTIYAAVPQYLKSESDQKFNGWYDVPTGTYYAARQGTARFEINHRMTQLEQENNETYAQFEARIKAKSLSWGVYQDEDKNQTFLANFGRVGDPDTNNGILYSDFNYYQSNPIFTKAGATGGNVVSYYIEFNTYYPDVVGEKTVSNYASKTSLENGVEKTTGNTISYTINNGDGFGSARKKEVSLQLIDEDTKEPIAGAEFKVQIYAHTAWIDTILKGTTDKNGKLTLGTLVYNKFRLVQTSTPNAYTFDNTTYGPSGNTTLGTLSNTGEFEVTEDFPFGFATIVTNKKKPTYTVDYVFESGTDGKDLPQEVMDLLPSDTNTYMEGTSIKAIQPEKTKVDVKNGTWTFKGYDADTKQATANVQFKGTWTFTQNALTLNHTPTIEVSDKELKVGDTFDEMKDVVAKDDEDGIITKDIKVTKNTVDTTKPGEYEVTYKVTDSQGASCTKTIKVKVIMDALTVNHAPTIEASDKQLTIGDTFDEMKDVVAKDDEDGIITKDIKVTKNTVNTKKVGEYEVTYKVTDSQGASCTKTIKVKVVGKVITKKTDSTNKKYVKTGTQRNIVLLVSLLVVSGAVLSIVLFKKKRNNK